MARCGLDLAPSAPMELAVSEVWPTPAIHAFVVSSLEFRR